MLQLGNADALWARTAHWRAILFIGVILYSFDHVQSGVFHIHGARSGLPIFSCGGGIAGVVVMRFGSRCGAASSRSRGFFAGIGEIFNLAGGPGAGLSFYGVYALVVQQLVMQLPYTMFISNNRASFHLW